MFCLNPWPKRMNQPWKSLGRVLGEASSTSTCAPSSVGQRCLQWAAGSKLEWDGSLMARDGNYTNSGCFWAQKQQNKWNVNFWQIKLVSDACNGRMTQTWIDTWGSNLINESARYVSIIWNHWLQLSRSDVWTDHWGVTSWADGSDQLELSDHL